MKLPQAFEEKMKGLLGEDFDSYIACFDNPRYYGLRVNTQKISVEEFRRRFSERNSGESGDYRGDRGGGRHCAQPGGTRKF